MIITHEGLGILILILGWGLIGFGGIHAFPERTVYDDLLSILRPGITEEEAKQARRDLNIGTAITVVGALIMVAGLVILLGQF